MIKLFKTGSAEEIFFKNEMMFLPEANF